SLDSFSVNNEFLFEADAKNTGVIVSFVSSSGANRTVVSEGANRALVDGDIRTEEFEKLLASADICLINGGLASDFVCTAIRAAKLARTKVILDPTVSSEQLQNTDTHLPLDYYTADVLVPNFAEAAELIAAAGHNVHTAKIIGTDLIARGAGYAIIKLGKKGAVVVNRENTTHIPAFDVKCIDRTGCGDAFDGALAASLAVGDEIVKAAKFATAAGALACSKFGAMEALPRKMEIIQLLQTLP
ncbi:MAG: PfkB family carbohydrate kinase, partial [Phycisphaerae bacterium]